MLLYKILKKSRVVLSLLVFAGIALFFSAVWIKALHFLPPLVKLQFVPALLGLLTGTFWVCIALLLFTLLFGRLYCSLLCPMGVLQDVFIRLANLFKTKKQKQFSYTKSHNILRYAILALVAVCWFIGFSLPIVALDPYSHFGRMATHLFGPVMLWLNNMLSSMAPDTLYYIRFVPVSLWIYIVTLALFVTIFVFSALRGRILCNTICPVGSFLGLIANRSLFRMAVDKSACNHCGLCGLQCKAGCINSKEQLIDHSRCIVCFNCTLVCKQNAVKYAFSWRWKRPVGAASAQEKVSLPRRAFIAAAGGVVGAAALYKVAGGAAVTGSSSKGTIAPPGARSHEHLKKYCTACQACVAACPSRILKPTCTGYGFDGWMLPAVTFADGFCNFNCTRCGEVCPSSAIERTPLEEKKLIQIGKARFTPRNCVVTTDKTDCGACDEHCPTKAVHMVPYGNTGLLRPQVDENLCIGCGACEFICPTSPKAIVVRAQPIHTVASPPPVEKQEQVQVDDFGF